jgi:TonB family protein
MIATTMIYLAAVSLAASIAALLADAGLRRLAMATRWLWLGAMVLGPALLGTTAVLRAVAWRPAPVLPTAVPLTIDFPELVFPVSDPGFAWRAGLERGLGILWPAASVILLLVLVHAFHRLEREKRGWRARRIRHAAVFISERRGPAVAGLTRGWVVLPRWVLGLPRRELRIVLRHEAEHLRAGDSRLVLAGFVFTALMPWSPFVWWQLRRLRTAVEIDCDRRVLARGGDVGAYGSALLSVAAGTMPGRPLAFAAFSEDARSLKTRIMAMTAMRSRWTRPAGVLLMLVAAAVAIQACGVEAPSTPTAPVIGERGAQLSQIAADEPIFTPFTVAPSLTNRQEVGQALETNYPPTLRAAGVEGRAEIWIRISDQGAVERVAVHKTSGTEALDQAALAVGRVMKFKPAQNRDQTPVMVWVSIPITFQVRPPATGAAASTPPPSTTDPRSVQRAPEMMVQGSRTVRPTSPEAEAPAGLAEGTSLLESGRFDDAVASFRRAVEAGADGDAAGNAIRRDASQRGIRREDWTYALRGLVAAKSFPVTAETRSQLDFWHGWALYHEAIRVEKPQTVESARVALPMFEQARTLFQAGQAYAAKEALGMPQIFKAVGTYIEMERAILGR